MEVMVILSYPLQLQTDLDPCILDKDNKIIQGWLENKSWLNRIGEDDHDLKDGSYLDYLSFEATFVFLTFLYYAVILVKNTGVLMLLSGVVKDRGGWPWPPGWFLAWLYIIWSNFCFQNFALDGFIKKLW